MNKNFLKKQKISCFIFSEYFTIGVDEKGEVFCIRRPEEDVMKFTQTHENHPKKKGPKSILKTEKNVKRSVSKSHLVNNVFRICQGALTTKQLIFKKNVAMTDKQKHVRSFVKKINGFFTELALIKEDPPFKDQLISAAHEMSRINFASKKKISHEEIEKINEYCDELIKKLLPLTKDKNPD